MLNPHIDDHVRQVARIIYRANLTSAKAQEQNKKGWPIQTFGGHKKGTRLTDQEFKEAFELVRMWKGRHL